MIAAWMTTTEALWRSLFGAEIESVIFVRDYLQITLYLVDAVPD